MFVLSVKPKKRSVDLLNPSIMPKILIHSKRIYRKLVLMEERDESYFDQWNGME